MNEELDPRLTGARGTQRETIVVSRGPAPRGGARGVQRDTVAMSPRIPARVRGVFTAAMVTSGWNGLVVFLPILVCVIAVWWFAGHTEPVNQVARFAAAAWLVGHDIPIEIAGGTLGVAPLVLVVAVCWRLSKAGAHTIRAINGRDFAAVRAVTLAVTLSYGIMITVVAFLVDSESLGVAPWRAALHGVVLSIVFATLGALAESGGGHLLWHRIPVWLRRGTRTGMLSVTIVVAAGALLTGVGIAAGGSTVTEITDGFAGAGIAVGVLSLLYLPTAAIWSVGYLVGPGFMLGADSSVRIIGVDLPAVLPPLPLFGAVPTAPLDEWGTLLLGIPPAIGIFYGVQLGLRSRDLKFGPLTGAALMSGLVAGGVVAGLTVATGGVVGAMTVGAPIWQTSWIAAAEIGAAVLIGSLGTRLLAGGVIPVDHPVTARR
ncbi:DUF6350 family protein [Stackebrandtia endophytica]|nr:DUF6350 family protein [Stackebrandtia endophytica]